MLQGPEGRLIHELEIDSERAEAPTGLVGRAEVERYQGRIRLLPEYRV